MSENGNTSLGELAAITPPPLSDNKKEITKRAEKYISKALYESEKTMELFKLPQEKKLGFVQVTRVSWKKKRTIGDKEIEYIPVRKVERLLNFVFNFQWSSKVIKQEFQEKKILKAKWIFNKTTKKKEPSATEKEESTILEAFVIVEFTARVDGIDLTRTVSGSWRMYENPAVSSYAVIQAAISQAKRNFAKEFGIGADLNEEIEERFEKEEELPPEKPKSDEEINQNFSPLQK